MNEESEKEEKERKETKEEKERKVGKKEFKNPFPLGNLRLDHEAELHSSDSPYVARHGRLGFISIEHTENMNAAAKELKETFPSEKSKDENIEEGKIFGRYGLQFHMSLPEDDEDKRKKGWDIVCKNAMEHDINLFKISVPSEKLSEQDKIQRGKDVTIYTNGNPEKTADDWINFMQETTEDLVENVIPPGYAIFKANKNLHSEQAIQGSNYFSYRYAKEDAVHKESPPQDYFKIKATDMKIDVLGQQENQEWKSQQVKTPSPLADLFGLDIGTTAEEKQNKKKTFSETSDTVHKYGNREKTPNLTTTTTTTTTSTATISGTSSQPQDSLEKKDHKHRHKEKKEKAISSKASKYSATTMETSNTSPQLQDSHEKKIHKHHDKKEKSHKHRHKEKKERKASSKTSKHSTTTMTASNTSYRPQDLLEKKSHKAHDKKKDRKKTSSNTSTSTATTTSTMTTPETMLPQSNQIQIQQDILRETMMSAGALEKNQKSKDEIIKPAKKAWTTLQQSTDKLEISDVDNTQNNKPTEEKQETKENTQNEVKVTENITTIVKNGM